MHVKTFFKKKYNMIFLIIFLERLGRMHKKIYIFYFLFFNVLTKTKYFNTIFVSLQYKNANQY
jgi:hypothetical protein